MIKKVVISPKDSGKAIAFFDELGRRKDAAKKIIEANTTTVREMLLKSKKA